MNLKLKVSNIRKEYAGTAVLKGASVSFDESGTYVLMGDNGSGKSTFLRICALLERPDSGSTGFVSGETSVPVDIHLKRRITLVLPRIGVFNASVLHNVLYGLKLRRMPRAESLEKAVAAIEFAGLAGRKDQNALTLSSGETQRIGLARALAIEPEILFLDEPTAFVDARNKEIIEDIIRNLGQDSRKTVIMTTHDPQQAVRLSGRRFRLQDGVIVDG